MATVTLIPDIQNQKYRGHVAASKTQTLPTGANGETDDIDIRGLASIGIILPTLTSTTLSVRVSDADGGTYQPLFTDSNVAVEFTTEVGVKAIDLPQLAPFNFFILRSSADQASIRTITIVGHV